MSEKNLYDLLDRAFNNNLTAGFSRQAVMNNPHIRVNRLPEGCKFINKGNHIDKIYLTIDGACTIEKHFLNGSDIIVKAIEPVQLLGLFELLGDFPCYQCNVCAVKDVIVIEIDADYLKEVVENNNDIARLLLKYMARFMSNVTIDDNTNFTNMPSIK